MAAPPNQSAGTAIDLGTLPANVVQQVDDGAINYTVWYKVTPTDADYVINVFPYGGAIGVGYQPSLSVFTGTGSTPYLNNLTNVGANRAAQFYTTAGQTLWFRLATNNPAITPATLTLDVQVHTETPFAQGDILVNDDNEDFQAGIINGDSSDIATAMRQFIGPPFASGETMARLPNGMMLIDNTPTGEQWLYTPELTRQAVVSIDPVQAEDEISPISTDGTQFFVGTVSGVNDEFNLWTVSDTGAIGATSWTLTGITQPEALAIAPDASVAYYATSIGNTLHNSRALKRWDLVNNVALPDLVAEDPSNVDIYRMLCLSDGTLVVIRSGGSSTTDIVAQVVNTTTGVTEREIDFSAYASTADPRMALSLDDPASFWVWVKLGTGTTTSGVSRFLCLQTSDLSILHTVNVQQYEKGRYQGTVVADPTRFGISESCDFVLLSLQQAPPDVGDPADYPIRYLRRAPIISDQEARIFHKRAQVVMQAGIGTTSGQGSDPQCMLRFSDDGGHTWSSERWQSIGRKGEYLDRILYYLLGQARNRVYEVVVSDPAVPVVLIDLVLDLEKGTN